MYRTLFEQMNEGFFLAEIICDRDGKPIDYRHIAANPALDQVIGLKSEEIIGKTRSEINLPPSPWVERFGQVALTGNPVEFEGFSQGLNRHLSIRAYSPKIGQFACLIQDITEQKRGAEEQEKLLKAVEEQHAYLQVIIDSLPVGVWIVNTTGKMIVVNDIARVIWGGNAPVAEKIEDYSVYKAWWRDSGKLITTDDMPLTRSLKSGETIKEKVIDFERFDGTKGTQLSSAAPIRDSKGNIIGAVCIVQDITELKQAEEALRKADQNKNQFISNLSHEIRNPLASMMLSLSLLKLAAPDSKQALQARETFERQTIQLSRLVDDLLEVTRISQNKIKLKIELVELNNLISNTIEDYRQMFAEKGIGLEFNRFPESIYLQADQTRLAQVMGNLLNNAYKFTDKDGKTQVNIRKDDKSKEAVISVKDNGSGIVPEQLQVLFQPFMQADISLDRCNGGLGLGLAIVKGIVELLDGSVKGYSDGLGKGSEFIIRLPLFVVEESKEDINCRDGNKVTSARRILVIEDIKDVAEIICSLLRYVGHEAISAPNGVKGLSAAKYFKPQVIFCDIGLPGMNGYEVARNIRKDEQLKDTYLIALSGYAQPEDLEKSKEAGFNRHLAKPIELAQLEEILNQDILDYQDIGARNPDK